ncbi:MAG: TetR/AcrR family transcriptional regulator [Lentisphaeria bacterium]|nr:TetR/AcrR family transcriptional regulator [Lentisphaeria bacterium]NQZ67285.1 TetR/AcrR family transcriptional regulator [Lentisphaeria bacterium]
MPQITVTKYSGNRQKLLQAAVDLIMTKGFECAGVAEILEHADTQKSNLYYHYKSKEELCLDAFDVIEEAFFDQVLKPTLLDKSLPAKERLTSYFDIIIQNMESQCCKGGCPFVNLACETSDCNANFAAKLDRFFEKYANAIQDCFRDGVANGEFRKDLENFDIGRFLVAQISGTMVLTRTHKNVDVIKNNREVLFQLIC